MFGMGTGGSLRLLSPESSRARSLLLPPFCPRQSADEWPPDFLSAALKEWGFHGFSIRGGLGLRSLPLAFPLRWFCASFASAQALALFMPSAPSKLHRLLTSLCPTKTSFRQLFSHILLSLSLLSASVRALALPSASFRFSQILAWIKPSTD